MHPSPFPAGKRTLLGPLDVILASCSDVGNKKLDKDSIRTTQTANTFNAESSGAMGLPSQQPAHLYALIKRVSIYPQHLPALHYHGERCHQGLGNVIPFPASPPANDREGKIHCHERLGGTGAYGVKCC